MEIYKNLDLNDLDGETWKEICGYGGDYFISNLGRVKSFKKWNGADIRILTQIKSNRGYLSVGLCKNKKLNIKLVHRLVCEIFHRKLLSNEIIHHIDGNKKNNLSENLKPMTISEHNGIHIKGNYIGEKNLTSKLTEEKVRIIYKISNSPTIKKLKINQTEIGEIFGIDQTTVSLIKNKKTWKHIQIGDE